MTERPVALPPGGRESIVRSNLEGLYGFPTCVTRRNTEGAMLFEKLVRPKPWPNQQTQLQEQIKGQEALIAAEPASGATIPRTEQSVIQPGTAAQADSGSIPPRC